MEDLKVEAGEPSIVFFHGMAFSLDNWISLGTLDVLTKKEFAVYAVDLPAGHSSKSDKVEKASITEYVPILEEVFAQFGTGDKSHPMVLIGPSMGGAFALAYAIAHPEAVLALVLVSPSISSFEQSELSKVETPVLLIWGDKDDVFPLEEYGRELKKELALSKLLILKGAGHAAYLDKPDEFHELLLDFLDEVL